MTVTERFITYCKFSTASDEFSETTPSTARQLDLSRYLVEELHGIGIENAKLDEYGRVYATLPGEGEPLGFIAHVDTSSDAPGENVEPQIVHYEGGDLAHLPLARFPSIGKYAGQDVIIADGKTLLGADDKAGVAEIVSAAEYLIQHPEIKHRPLAMAFTCDEEVGRGAEHFDFEAFGAKEGYTLDGGELGEIEYENFNAASAVFTVHGINIHPGEGKDKMKNASLIAVELLSMMPAAETPAHTENYEGFYHLNQLQGDETEAKIYMIIRDHDMEKFLARKKFVENLAAYMNSVYGEGTVELQLRDSYYNMKEKILPHMELIDNAVKAFRSVGAEPNIKPIRGGTDGALLSYQGLPCPNLSTGGANFHGIHEYIPVRSLEKMVGVVVSLLTTE